MGKCTKEFGVLVDTIITECSLYPPVDYTKQPLPEPILVKEAMWDTGADVCVINKRIADRLGIIPTGQMAVDGVRGEDIADACHIHIKLPTNDYIMNVETIIRTKTDYDFVIGMNVIAHGDIAISTADDKTVFSVRIPSEGHIKF
ncbi:MAG: retroviral-like aspartic protease family protein [Prevotella sp.]|nr:retroviral-like aspartic protease family protein [Prevotella sp.]MDD7002776.1 retroviral-like aspartic protease family protein [Segatella copri]MDD7246829.1 retroviral-like aspartic protease family protein [Prevotellaceae bacterium]MCI6805573.1 retroviral-like aspartic protease family protein [Prevotella sp.]MCI7270024.1 retroviral-like aspartic protease family protein [Prevotella sp.]